MTLDTMVNWFKESTPHIDIWPQPLKGDTHGL